MKGFMWRCAAALGLVLVAACTPNPTGPTSTTTTTAPPADPAQVAVGPTYACAVTPEDVVKCWGRNDSGQLGTGTMTDSPTPVQVLGLTDVESISAAEPPGSSGASTTCAVRSDGTAWCWGMNSIGTVGSGSTNAIETTPQQVANLTDVEQVSVGNVHACARTADGAAHCWGWGIDGRLGNGDASNQIHRVPVQLSGIAEVVDISAGTYHSCLVRADGTVWCWGSNASGQLGTGDQEDALTPVQVAGVSDAVAVGTGESSTCALRSTGEVACWGWNSVGELGAGTTEWSLTPVPVAGLSDATAVSVGPRSACARSSNGVVRCWGSDRSGAMGQGSTATARPTPVVVPGTGAADGVSINGQFDFGSGPVPGQRDLACVASGPVVRCAGSNEFGQLGNGTTEDSDVLVDVAL